MPGYRDQRHSQQRPDPTNQRPAWGSDPATARPPDRRPTPPPAWPTPTRRGGTRRGVHPLNVLLIRPLRLIVFAFARAMLRAVIPWLLPLGILGILAVLGIYLSNH